MLKYIAFTYLLFCIIPGNLSAQEQQINKADSILYTYYQNKCVEDPTNPEVLLVADSLFELAKRNNHTQMQISALRAKLNHYYYKNDGNNTDSIIAWVDRIKDFSRQHNDLESYYFVWSARLINHYIGMGEYNIALVETEKMLKEAEAEDFKEGIADCYGCMSNIYSAKQLMGESLEFLLKEIEIFEKYQLKRQNISLKYSDAASIYISQGEKEKASTLLKKATEYSKTPYHEVTAKLAYMNLYLEEGDIAQADRLLEECRKMYHEEPSLKRHIRYFYEMEVPYYRKIKKYDEALQALELFKEELIKKGETISIISLLKTKADIYWDMNRKEEAGIVYREYFEAEKAEKEKNEEITTGEFATLLNMQKLNVEKKELEEISKEKQLQNIRNIVFFMAVVLCIVIFFLYYQSKLNKKLKRSRDKLDEKNRILLNAEEDLRKAKEIAEHSSQLKTVFIQSMSHEIRTPLNSIVGFSAVLADLFSEESEDVKQFATLIEKNSQLLLKLVSDILDLSSLDDIDLKFEYSPTDIHACCLSSIETAGPLVAEGVKLIFKPESEQLIINSNHDRIVQVLNNLLNNAAKFTEKGEITLAYEIEGEKELILTITDTGMGIPLKDQKRVFDRFVKLDDFSQGTGLGLPICKIIAEKMGGYLTIDREYTEGCRFIFCIPIR